MEFPEIDPMLGEVMDGKQDNFSPGFLVISKNKMTHWKNTNCISLEYD